MTIDAFRTIALSMPDAAEREHMDQPDFRVRNKVFATLPRVPQPKVKNERTGMAKSATARAASSKPLAPSAPLACVKLTPEQQRGFITSYPAVFYPAASAWGVRGFTMINLSKVPKAVAKLAVILAWRNAAPARMVQELSPPLPRIMLSV